MIERDELARRLEPVLSETPESARDLMARAGLATGSRIAGVVTVALLQLKREGKARSHGAQPNIKWTRVTADQGVERLPLARLDATLILTTTARTTAGGTRRTELAATVELGPSWPAGTHPPPRWSTAFSDAQLATGAMTGARTNAIARAEAQLRALRKDKTLPLLPTEEPVTNRPNPLLLPSKNRETFFSYLASVQPDGARRDSACGRLATLGLATTTAEAERWLDELVEQGLLAERTKRAGDGTTVVRYLPVEPTTPAPLPKSSAPAEELPAGKPLPAPKVTPKAARKAPAAPVADEDTGDPTDDEGALDDPAEHDSEDPPQVEQSGEVARLTRERDEARAQVLELDRGWDVSRAELAGGLEAPPDSSWADLIARARSLRVEAGILHRQMNEIGEALGLPPNTVSWKLIEAAQVARSQVAAWQNEADSLGRERASLRQQLDAALAAKSPTKHPQHYQGDPAEQFATSIAGWLVSLSEEAWQQVQQARTDLAKARDLREQSHSLELHALDALDRAVGARPAAPPAPVAAPVPAPAPELVPDPIELGPALPVTPEPPASGEQANDQAEGGTMLERVRRFFEQHPTEADLYNAPMLAERLGCLAKHVSPSLSILFREGFLEKPRLGFYRLARKGRRAA